MINCDLCELSLTRKNIVEGEGSSNASIFFIGEAPGATEDIQGKPFVGDSGQVFRDILRKSGILETDIFVDNVVKCYPPKNREPKPSEIKACFLYLDQNLRKIKPKVIVPMGNIPLKALTGMSGITFFQGQILYHPKYQSFIIPVLHPAALYRDLQEGKLYRYKKTLSYFQLIKEYSTKKIRHSKRQKILVSSIESFRVILSKIREVKEFGFDIETSGFDIFKDEIIGISLSYWNKIFYDFYIPKSFIDWNFLKEVLENRENLLIGHNLKFDGEFLLRINVDIFKKPVFDTMIAFYLLNEDAKGHYDLKTHSWMHYIDFGGYEEELKSFLSNKEISFSDIPLKIISKYAALDAEATLRLKIDLFPKLEKEHLFHIFEMLMKSLRVFAEIELNGIKININYLLELEKTFFNRLESISQQMRKLLNDEKFNPRSPKQIREVFEKLKIISPETTETGLASTNEKALLKLKGSHPFIDLMLEYRESFGLYSTHIKGVKEKIYDDGRIHPVFLLHGTATGRIVSTQPNTQQVPKMKEFRDIYVPDEGNVFVEGDYSQAELRVLAHLSKDPVLIEAYRNGEDIHEKVAMEVFGVSKQEAKAYRKIAKGINFGLIYGRGEQSLAEELGISTGEAKEYIRQYFRKMPRVALFRNNMKQIVMQNGFIISMFGRKRRLQDSIWSGDNYLVKEAERQSLNFPMQATASDITVKAMIEFFRIIDKPVKLINFVHDSILVECKEEDKYHVANILKTTMENIVKLDIPLVADIVIGKTWGECL